MSLSKPLNSQKGNSLSKLQSDPEHISLSPGTSFKLKRKEIDFNKFVIKVSYIILY